VVKRIGETSGGPGRISRLGAHCWGTSPESVASLEVAAAAGVGWIRSTRPMQMDSVMAGGPGTFAFEAAGEGSVDRAAACGLRVLGLLDGRWGNEGPNKLGWCSPIWEHWGAWEDFVAATIERYRGRVHCWEVLNEPYFFWWYPMDPAARHPGPNPPLRRAPIRRYAEMLRRTSAVIRALDPSAKIVSGASAHDGYFLERLYAHGCKDCFDIVGVHYLPFYGAEPLRRSVGRIREVMAAAGDEGKPVWDTESGPGGAVIGWAELSGLEHETAFNIRRHCLAEEFGVERYFWFNPCQVEGGHAIRLRDGEGDLSAPYLALRALATLLGDGPLLEARHPAGGRHEFVFEGREGIVSVLWSDGEAEVDLSGRSVFDATGAPVAAGRILGSMPVFVLGDVREREISVSATRPRQSVPSRHQPAADCPRLVVPAWPGGAADDPSAWAAIPFLCTPDDAQRAPHNDHFVCWLPTNVGGSLQLAWDERALFLRAVVGAFPDAELQIALRDSPPDRDDWGTWFNAWGLFTALHRAGRTVALRHHHLLVDEFPTALLSSPVARPSAASHAVEFLWRLPWAEIGPVRPGANEPFLLMAAFRAADRLLDLPAEDRPEEWQENFGDSMIVTPPPVIAWLDFR